MQIIGKIKLNKTFGDNIPSVSNHKGDIQYSLPFKGKWAVINGCYSKKFSHSWDIPTQRYAYDFIILDEECKSYQKDFKNCENYYCYESEILAPADGVVVEILNNANDSVIYSRGKCFLTAKHIAGNYIIIKHGEHEYSTLAHLKKDSLIVKVGDVVSRGNIIAKCGNTGNSTEPHLHFQVQTGQNFYSSAGIPVNFRNIVIEDIINYDKLDPRQYMPKEQILKGYISRGYNVSNEEREGNLDVLECSKQKY